MPGPAPKPKEQRQRRNQHLEVGVDTHVLPLTDRPDGLTAVPKAPGGLLKASRVLWASYWQSPVARAVDVRSDGHRLVRWIRAVDEWERVGADFRKERRSTGSKGQPVLNPLATYIRQCESAIQAAEAELGMTPMARLRMGLTLGAARLTAMELTRRLDKNDRERGPLPIGEEAHGGEPVWEAEWQEA